MADLRLLKLLVCLVLAGASLGCALGPIYAPRVEGQVLDKNTRKPVEGALVFTTYEMVWATHRRPVDTRWAQTDSEGRFAIPGHFSMTLGPPFSSTDPDFFLTLVHPGYGLYAIDDAERIGGSRYDLLFELEPNSSRRLLEESGEYSLLCSRLSHDGCDRMCEYAYGSAEACYAHGRLRH